MMAGEPDDSSPLERLGAKLEIARAREREQAGDGGGARAASGEGLGLGFRVVTELVAAVIVGTLIGYGLDRWLGSAPWLMVVFLLLGSASGILNAYRAAKGYEIRARSARERREDG